MKNMKKIILLLVFLCFGCSKNSDIVLENYVNKDISELKTFASNSEIKLDITEEYNYEYEKNKIISQSIKENTKIKKGDTIKVTVSLGEIPKEKLKEDNINELGKVPIMMYHQIVDKKNSDTNYTGGNVDKDGYIRTTESFKKDLEFYYENGYRMIRLDDYIDGKIDVQYGKSPIIITFDDGAANNIKVKELDKDGNIVIDENSAVGILESFKKKYPDYNVTATFFVNDILFNQKEYDEKILKWLVDNNYSIGNHTKGHIDISKKTSKEVEESIGYVYEQLENIIPGQYLKIVALPFGSPYKKEHNNFNSVLKSNYNNKEYITNSTLRVGWEPEESSYSKNFDKTFLKRCRAYDNDGKEFDIEMVFKNLKKNRYISDGMDNIITIKEENKDLLKEIENKKVNAY